MNEDLIRRLVQMVDENNINEIEYSRWGKKIRITKSPAINTNEMVYHTMPQAQVAAAPQAAAPVSAPAATEDKAEEKVSGHILKSPIVGTFYRSPAPGEASFVKVGDQVEAGQTLCIIEAMKIMNEIEADVSGTIKEIYMDNAVPVEYDSALFRIE